MFFSNAMLDYYTIYMRLPFCHNFGAQVVIWHDQYMHPLGMKPTPMFCTIWWEPSENKNPYLKHIRLRANNAQSFKKLMSCRLCNSVRWFMMISFCFFWEKINFQHNNLNGSTLQKKNNESTWPQLGGGFKAVVFHQPIWNICARQNWIIYPVIGLKIPKKCLKKTPPMA